jgi:hypothetical protein
MGGILETVGLIAILGMPVALFILTTRGGR